MRILTSAVAACVAATCVYASPYAIPQRAGAHQQAKAAPSLSPPALREARNGLRCDPSRIDIEAAGSNFILSSVGRFNQTRSLADDEVKPPFVEILENPEKVKAQLRKLYESGQRKISTVIWHAPLIGKNEGKIRIGYLVNSDGGAQPEIYAGLEAYFQAVKATGFQELVIRFGLQGCAHPSAWVPGNKLQCPTSYSEKTENDNYSLITNVHDMVDRIFADTAVIRWYDLALEGVGWREPFPTYNARVWKRYLKDYGPSDSYGFSIAYQPGRLTQIYKIYDEIGVRPPMVAVDMYDAVHGKRPRMQKMLAQFAEEMDKNALRGAPMVIQESYYNHKPTYQAIASAVQSGMNIRAVYQWPMDTTDTWNDTPYRYDAYCPALIEDTAAKEASIQGSEAGQRQVR